MARRAHGARNASLCLALVATGACSAGGGKPDDRAPRLASTESALLDTSADGGNAGPPALSLSVCWYDSTPVGVDPPDREYLIVQQILTRELMNRVDVGLQLTDFTGCGTAALTHDLPIFINTTSGFNSPLGLPPPGAVTVTNAVGTVDDLERQALTAIATALVGIDPALALTTPPSVDGLTSAPSLSAAAVAALRAKYVAPRLPAPSAAVALYAAPGFAGTPLTLPAGTWLASTAPAFPQALGSIVVPEGLTVTACTSENVDARWLALGRGPCRRVTGDIGGVAYLGPALAAAVKRIDIAASVPADASSSPSVPLLGSGTPLRAWSSNGTCDDSPPTSPGATDHWQGSRLFPPLTSGTLSHACIYAWAGVAAPLVDDLAAWTDGPSVDPADGAATVPCAAGVCAPPTTTTTDGQTTTGQGGGRAGCDVCNAQVADGVAYVTIDPSLFQGTTAIALSYTVPAIADAPQVRPLAKSVRGASAALVPGATLTALVPFSGQAAFVVPGAFPAGVSGVASVDSGDIFLVNVLPHPSDLTGWTILQDGGDGWAVGGSNDLLTSYGWDIRQQDVDLAAIGYSPAYMDTMPVLSVSERFSKTYCGGKFLFQITLLDANKNVVGTMWDGSGNVPSTSCAWDSESTSVAKTFSNYGTGVRYLRWTDGGIDTLYWAGYYGPELSEASLHVTSL